jgi:hypothetical protein
MNVVMVHPVHGAKIAINLTEVEQDEQNGWSRYNADTPAAVAEVAPKRKYTRRVVQTEQPNEVPSFLASVSDESEGT